MAYRRYDSLRSGRISILKLTEILEYQVTNWDKRIAADLTGEMERHLADRISTIPEMRRFLAVKGYRELRHLIETSIAGKSGADALRAAMISMRRYALDRPGMSAATFRNPEVDSPEWRTAQMELAGIIFTVFLQLASRAKMPCMPFESSEVLCAASSCTRWVRHFWSRSSTTRATRSESRFLSKGCACCGISRAGAPPTGLHLKVQASQRGVGPHGEEALLRRLEP
jgi:hypothetical protein